MGNASEKGKIITPEETKKMGTVKGMKKENRMPIFMFGEDKREKKEIKIEQCELPFGLKKEAYVLRDAFTKEECAEMIQWTEDQLTYMPALLNIGYGKQILDTEARNHKRAMYDSSEMVAFIFERVKDYLPQQWLGKELSCLNERLRFLKYHAGGYFAPHWDGTYERDDKSEQSHLTLILYLNEGFEGGETNFLEIHPSSTKKNEYPVGITTGSILLFQHDIYHEGSLLVKGEKYCVRTDVMYKNPPQEKELQFKLPAHLDETSDLTSKLEKLF